MAKKVVEKKDHAEPKKVELKEHTQKAPKTPRVKKTRTVEQVEADREKMAKLRLLIKKK